MSRACLTFAFAVAYLIAMPLSAAAQPNSERESQVPGQAPEPPARPKAVQDSLKASRAKAKTGKAKSSAPGPTAAPAVGTPATSAPVTGTPAPAAPGVPAAGAAAAAPSPGASAARDTSAVPPIAVDSAKHLIGPDTVPRPEVESPVPQAVPRRTPPDLRLINDPPLIAREYGFGVLGSVVAGTLCFYIGSGLETAIMGERRAHKGTLSFTGIRYDNFKGAFWGGSAGVILGSAFTTYFTGQTDEEDGGFFATLAGATAAAAGAFYVASLMGVNDDIDWKPFLPLLVIPSVGGTLGFNLSRWYHDHEREKVVSKEAAVRLHAPDLAWGLGAGGERVELRALRLTF